MATTVLPLDAASGSPSYSAQATRQAFSAFLGPAPSGRPVGAISGVRDGTPSTTVSVTATTWSCAAHSGVLDVEASAVAGPYLYATDGTDTGSITAADATNPRVDIVYVQVNDNVQDASGLESGIVGYLAGTPAVSPVAPIAPARSLVLATISVPKTGGGNPAVSWVAPTFGVAGWTIYTPQWTAASVNPTLGNSTMQGRYRQVGKTVNYFIRLTIGSTASATNAGAFYFSAPVAFSTSAKAAWIPVGQVTLQDVSANAQYVRTAIQIGDNQSIALTDTGGNLVTQAVPFAITAGDIITITGHYESV